MEPKSPLENCIFEDYLRRPSRRRLARVVKAFHGYVWNLARRFTRNEEDAADLGQELFLSLLLHPPAQEAVRSVRGYLSYRILTLASNSARSRERRRQRELKAAQTAAAESGLPPGDLEAVHAAIEGLPERTRTVVQYRYLAGLRNREIAGILGVSERTVEDELHAGRESLRARLGSRALGALLFLERVPQDQANPPAAFEEELLRIAERGNALLIAGGAATGAGIVWKGIAAAAAVVILTGLAVYTAANRGPGPAPGQVVKTGRGSIRLEAERKTSAEKVPEPSANKAPAGDEPGPRLSISGWVVEETGEVVPDATVRMYSGSNLIAEARTNEGGRFTSEGKKPELETITLVAEKEGLGKGWLSTRRLKTPVLEGVVVALFSSMAELTGRVVDQEGRPIEGANVEVFVQAGALGEPYVWGGPARAGNASTTDREGSFVVKGLPASAPIDVVAERPGYYRDKLREVMAGGAPVELRLEKGDSVSGRVIDGDSKPVEGAEVHLTEDASPHQYVQGRFFVKKTGAEGGFEFNGVPDDRYDLSVYPPAGYGKPPTASIEVRGPVEVQEIVLEAPAGEKGEPSAAAAQAPGPEEAPSIRGTISDPLGNPVVALVATTNTGSLGFVESRRESVSRPDGSFLLQYVSFPTKLIAAAPSRALRKEMVIELEPESDLEIRLEPYGPCRIEGRVVTSGGRTVPGAGVLVGRTWENLSVATATTLADREGRFVLDRLLPDTGYRFHAVVGGIHGPATYELVRAGKTSRIEVLLPSREATLSGVVRDRAGNPLSGIKVYFDYQEDNVPLDERLVSGVHGEFLATGLLPGKYRVLVDENGYVVWAENEVILPGPPVEIKLVKTRVVHFELVDGSGVPLNAALLSGKATFGTPLQAAKGKFSAEIAESESRLKFQRPNGQPPEVERDLDWPPTGDLDLGRIELKAASP